MTVGQDSYVTVAEADTYVAAHYLSTDPARTRWAALEAEDKDALLLNACLEIELLPFHGWKTIPEQPMMFPRLPYQYNYEMTPPDRVKSAQIELAIWLADTAARTEQAQRQALKEQGVASFNLGDLSESYNQAASAGGELASGALACPKSRQLLSIYLQGSYDVR